MAGTFSGEDADGVGILELVAGGSFAADDVVVEGAFELPVFLFGEFGEMLAAVEALLLAGDGDEDQGGGDFDLRRGRGRIRVKPRCRWHHH